MPSGQWDFCTVLTLVAVIGCLGEGVTHLTTRMAELRTVIRGWAVGLGIVTGILAFFALSSQAGAKSPDGLLGAIVGGGIIGLGASSIWYLVVAVVTFLAHYLAVTPYRFLFGSSLLPLVGAILGFIAGVVHAAIVLERNQNIGAAGFFTIVGLYTVGGSMAPRCVKWLFSLLGSVFSWTRHTGGKAAVQYQDFAERRRVQAAVTERESVAKRTDTVAQAEREVARKHLIDFYLAHQELLMAAFPPALMDAFIACEMSDALSPAQLWAVCHQKIAQFQPIIVQEQAKKKLEHGRAKKREIRIKQIDGDIRTCKEKISRLATSGLDADFIADETHGLLMRIRQLEEQKELLSTLGEMVDA